MGKKERGRIAGQTESRQQDVSGAKQALTEREWLPSAIRHSLEILAVIGALFGGALMAENFWYGVAWAYAAFILLEIGLWLDHELRPPAWRGSVILAVPPIVACVFTYACVIRPAPIKVDVLDYYEGVSVDERGRIGDIQWRKEYYDVRLFIGADRDYSNLKIDVETDLYIAEVGRFGKCLDGSIEPGVISSPLEVWDESGKKVVGKDEVTIGKMTFQTLRYQRNWRIRCDELKRGDMMQFVLAVVSVDESDMHRLLPAKKPQWVEVKLEYETMGRRVRNFSVKKPVGRPWVPW